MPDTFTLSTVTIMRRALPHGFPTWEDAAAHHWDVNKRQMVASVADANDRGSLLIPILLDRADDGTLYVLDGVRRVLVGHTLMLPVPIEIVNDRGAA